MFDFAFGSTRAQRNLAGKILLRHSAAPRMRPRRKIITEVLMGAVILVLAEISFARAQTDLPDGEPAATLSQAAPAGRPEGPGRPPREAVEACAGLPAETACGFAGRDGQQINGVCRSPKADLPAACVPAEMPRNG